MNHSVLIEYDIGTSDWNAPTKEDFIYIAEWMLETCTSKYSNSLFCKIEVEYKGGSSSEFSLEEFKRNFSTSSIYSSVNIGLFGATLFYLTCRFHPHKSARLITASGDCFTLPELEDLSQGLKSLIENMYSGIDIPAIVGTQSISFVGSPVPPKVEVSLSESEHTLMDEKGKKSLEWDKRRIVLEIVGGVFIAIITVVLTKLLS